MDTNNDTARSAILGDLGVAQDRQVAGVSQRPPARMDVTKIARDLQDYTDGALNRSVPETLIERFIDAVMPSKARALQRRAEGEMVEARIESRIAMARTIYNGQVEQVAAMIDTAVRDVRLQAAEDVAVRGLDAADRVDSEIARSGAVFDRKLEADVEAAASLKTNIAKHAAATRLEQRIAMRASVEKEAMNNVREAVRSSRRERS